MTDAMNTTIPSENAARLFWQSDMSNRQNAHLTENDRNIYLKSDIYLYVYIRKCSKIHISDWLEAARSVQQKLSTLSCKRFIFIITADIGYMSFWKSMPYHRFCILVTVQFHLQFCCLSEILIWHWILNPQIYPHTNRVHCSVAVRSACHAHALLLSGST